MKKLFQVLIIFSTLVFLSQFYDFGGEAYGYNLFPCNQNSIVTWAEETSLTATNRADLDLALFNINSIPANVFFTEDDTDTDLVVKEIFEAVPTLGGRAMLVCAFPPLFEKEGSIAINTFNTDSYPSQKRQAIWAHELLHGLGLDHSGNTTSTETSLMHASIEMYNSHKIFVPVLDDINGLQAIYGETPSTPQCNFSSNNGQITYTGTCSSENSALPMTEEVLTSDSGHRTFAYDKSTGDSLPSSGTALFTTKVTSDTLYRFSTGIHTNTDVSDSDNRFATIELDNDGIKAVTSNFIPVTTISGSSPQVGTTYFLELVVQEGKDAVAYAYEDNGTPTVQPTFLGSATFATSGSWSGTKFFGTGVWTDNTSNPKSNYDVDFYSNHFLCLPPESGNWDIDFSCTIPKNSTAPANVIIDSSSRLTIPQDITLDIKFDSNNLQVISESSVMIRDGGKID